MSVKRKTILAVASGGGHWVQLLRLRPAFEGHNPVYVTVNRAYRADVGESRFCVISDATRWDRLRLVWMALQLAVILLRFRPQVVVSTGAAPGYFAIRMGRWLGARTVWLDSLANVDSLSLSGQKVGNWVDLWLTQWPHLARPGGPSFVGCVL